MSKQEIRGVWLTNISSNVLFEREQLKVAISELSQLHLNTLYPTVWNWGYTLYPSHVMDQEVGLLMDPRPIASSLKNRNILEELVVEGHKNGFAVIPWFEFGFMAPKNSEIAQKHKDWWTKKQNGSVDGDPMALDGVQIPIWFNPFKPSVQNFILKLVSEIVSNAEVDGIQLDDHFGLPVEFGYDDYTVKLYKEEHNGQSPPLNQHDPDWITWKSEKLELFLKKLFQTVKSIRKDAIISLSPLEYPWSRDNFLVDWYKWDRAGLIEEVIPQIYFKGSEFDSRIRIDDSLHPERLKVQQHIPTAIGISTGTIKDPVSIDEIERQVMMSRKQGYSGVSFFFYETFLNKLPNSETRGARKEKILKLFPSSSQHPKI